MNQLLPKDSRAMSIPLKPLQETFIDDPLELDDVFIGDLVFDIEHGLKNINNLHSLHAIAILLQCVTDVIVLLSQKGYVAKFLAENQWKTSLAHRITQSAEDLSPTTNGLAPTLVAIENEGESSQFPVQRFASNFKDSFDQDLITPPKESEEHDNALGQQQLIKAFSLLAPPPLSVRDFLLRIRQYSPSISSSIYVHLALLLSKILLISNTIRLTDLNVHRLILTVVRISAKLLEDRNQKQSAYATIVGVSKPDLLKFELGYLFLAHFDIVANEEELDNFLTEQWLSLYKYCRKHIGKRGDTREDVTVRIGVNMDEDASPSNPSYLTQHASKCTDVE